MADILLILALALLAYVLILDYRNYKSLETELEDLYSGFQLELDQMWEIIKKIRKEQDNAD